MKKSYIGIIILIITLVVGFAAVTTNFIINNKTTISANYNEFDVYFSEALTDEGGSATISEDKKTITFDSKKLSLVNDSAVLNYSVTNASSQYDADVSVTFTANNLVDGVDYSSYYSITRSGFDIDANTEVDALKTVNGSITITLLQPALEDISVTFTLTLNANAKERTEEAEPISKYTIVSGNLDTVGSIVSIGDEEFYVIGQEDETHVKLLAKYNLGVGNGFEVPTNKQEEIAMGYKSGAREPYPGIVVFSDTNYWYNAETKSIDAKYGTKYSAYVYDDNSFIKPYVDNYVSYLRKLGGNVTGRLISTDELSALKCSGLSCESAPKWVYSTSYWTGSASNSTNIWNVHSNGYYGNNYKYNDGHAWGIRPVIILKK